MKFSTLTAIALFATFVLTSIAQAGIVGDGCYTITPYERGGRPFYLCISGSHERQKNWNGRGILVAKVDYSGMEIEECRGTTGLVDAGDGVTFYEFGDESDRLTFLPNNLGGTIGIATIGSKSHSYTRDRRREDRLFANVRYSNMCPGEF